MLHAHLKKVEYNQKMCEPEYFLIIDGVEQ